MSTVTAETDGRTYSELINHPTTLEDFDEPVLGALKRTLLAAFDALDIDGNHLHNRAFVVQVTATVGTVAVSIDAIDEE